MDALEPLEPQVFLRPAAFDVAQKHESKPHSWAIKRDFVGANPGVIPVGQDRTPAVISNFIGGVESVSRHSESSRQQG